MRSHHGEDSNLVPLHKMWDELPIEYREYLIQCALPTVTDSFDRCRLKESGMLKEGASYRMAQCTFLEVPPYLFGYIVKTLRYEP